MLATENKSIVIAALGFGAVSLGVLLRNQKKRPPSPRPPLPRSKDDKLSESSPGSVEAVAEAGTGADVGQTKQSKNQSFGNTTTASASSIRKRQISELEVVDSLVAELVDIIAADTAEVDAREEGEEDQQILSESLDAFLVSTISMDAGLAIEMATIGFNSEWLGADESQIPRAKEYLRQIQLLSACIRALQCKLEQERNRVTVETTECEKLRGKLEKELELRQEAEQKVSLMQQSITRLELETEQKRGKLVKLQEEVNALNFRILSSRSEAGSNDSQILKWATLHSEQDRINKEKEELRKTMLILAKAKIQRKAAREDLIARVNARKQVLDTLVAENDEKKRIEEEKRIEMEKTSIYDESYGTFGPTSSRYNDADSESSYDSNVSIFGSFGRSSSESGYGLSEGEEYFPEDRWG